MGLTKGQKFKLTDEVRLKIEEAAAMDCSVPEMALWANVSRASVYNWLKDDPEWASRIDDLRAKPFLKARNTIIGDLDKTETAKWYMERKKKLEFAARTEHTGADGKELTVNIVKYNDAADDSPPVQS